MYMTARSVPACDSTMNLYVGLLIINEFGSMRMLEGSTPESKMAGGFSAVSGVSFKTGISAI